MNIILLGVAWHAVVRSAEHDHTVFRAPGHQQAYMFVVVGPPRVIVLCFE